MGRTIPVEERVDAVMPIINAHADRTGHKVMYAFNITDELDAMLRHHDYVAAAGGTCAMVAVNSVGLAGVAHLRRHCRLALHGHRAGWGLYSRSPHIGMSFIAYQKLWRLAGVDHLHVNGLANKFSEADDSVIASARACLTPMFPPPAPGCEVMPVFSSGQTARQAVATYQALGSTDLIFCAGGGIMAHPGGIASGVRSLRQAWDAAVQGVSLETLCRRAPRARPGPGDLSMSTPTRHSSAYYGDDLTGSTDALEALSSRGVSTVLFTAIPDDEQLARFAECRAIGLAGTSRSESPAWMHEHLTPALTWLRERRAGLCHYKTCSTFDSAPRSAASVVRWRSAARCLLNPVCPSWSACRRCSAIPPSVTCSLHTGATCIASTGTR